MLSKTQNYFYGRHCLDEEDIQSVIQVLRSDFLSQGPKLQEFEEKIALYCKARYCLGVANGTAGLHLACLALGLKRGDIGWTSPLSFVASANCIRYCGAKVDFVDIDSETFNISPSQLASKFAKAAVHGKLPKVLIPVHFAGQSCNMKEIHEIATRYNCSIIEDACHALGGKYDGFPVGSCRYSDITVFSLHPVKSITSGEGGLILTNDGNLYDTMKTMRAHGIVSGNSAPDRSMEPWHREVQCEGYNYKITDIQCALGVSQLKKLDRFIAARQQLADRYKERLKDISYLHFQKPLEKAISAWHIMVVLIDFDAVGKTKQDVYRKLQACGIHLSLHYYPIHLNPLYKRLGFKAGDFPKAESYYKRAFTLPLHPALTLDDVDYICNQLRRVIG